MNSLSKKVKWTRMISRLCTGIMSTVPGPQRSRARTGTLMAVGSMSSVQLGLALSVPLFAEVGPLGAAVARTRGGRLLLWPALAGAGVLLLTQPWQGGADPAGIACALGAAG